MQCQTCKTKMNKKKELQEFWSEEPPCKLPRSDQKRDENDLSMQGSKKCSKCLRASSMLRYLQCFVFMMAKLNFPLLNLPSSSIPSSSSTQFSLQNPNFISATRLLAVTMFEQHPGNGSSLENKSSASGTRLAFPLQDSIIWNSTFQPLNTMFHVTFIYLPYRFFFQWRLKIYVDSELEYPIRIYLEFIAWFRLGE